MIAGYHWFTDWGRDTMISLEGLTLSTHRYREAGYILRTFAHYVRDGLIPNMFPGRRSAKGCTTPPTRRCGSSTRSSATRASTGDAETLRTLLPTLRRHRPPSPRRHALRHPRRSGRRPATPGGSRAISSRGWTPRSTTGSSRRAAARRSRSTRSGTTRSACCSRWTRASSAAATSSTSRDARDARARVVQRRFWYDAGRLSLRRRRRRERRRSGVPAEPGLRDLAAAPGARPRARGSR